MFLWGALHLLACAVGAAGELRGPRPLDRPWVEDPGFRIEWRETWQATDEANTARWKGEVEAATQDRRLRSELLTLRRIRLLEALRARFPDDAEHGIAALKELAKRYRDIGCTGRANYRRKELVDAFPERPDAAADALAAILQDTRHRVHYVEEDQAWLDYATSRLIALHEAARLPGDHPGHTLAWQVRLEELLRQKRHWEAARALARLAAVAGRDDAWRTAEAQLHYQAGRAAEALRLSRDLVERGVRGPARSWATQLSRETAAWPVGLRSSSLLDARWERIRNGGFEPDAGVLDSLIEQGAEDGGLIDVGGGVHASLWAAVDRHIGGRPPARLREAQHWAARRRLRRLGEDGALGPLMGLFRRYPWARAVHEAMLTSGEQALRSGRSGDAARMFGDVVRRAADPDLRARATVGLWLAVASRARFPDALQSAFRTVSDEARLPWMGERRPAGWIKRRLLASLPAGRDEPTTLRRGTLKPPPAAPWPADPRSRRRTPTPSGFPVPDPGLTVAEGRLVLAAPGVLAVYGADLTRPLWWRTPGGADAPTAPRHHVQLPFVVSGRFLPALGEGRVYCRWGRGPSGGHPTDLAAVDAATGEMLWSTWRDAAWGGLSPIGDPALAEGRVYVLATRGWAAPVQRVLLVCLDAAGGRVLWRRTLGSQRVALRRASEAPPLPQNEVDLARYGSGVAIHQGAVYCSTGMGLVARCDARDGLVEWVHPYERVRLGANTLAVLRRQGGPPVVAGDAVVFLPRDGEGLFALDRRTGRRLWEIPFVPSSEAAGTAGTTLVLRDATHLVGLDASRGTVAWSRRFADGLVGRPAVVGSAVYAAAGAELWRLDAKTGRTLERRPRREGEATRGFFVRGDAIAAVGDGAVCCGPSDGPTAPDPAAGPLRLPLRRSWHVRRQHPALQTPPPEAKLAGRVYLVSQGRLECIDLRASGAIAWQRLLAERPAGVGWADRTLLLLYPERVLAIDGLTGARRWEALLPFAVTTWGVCGPYLLVGTLPRGRALALLRLSTGERLWHRRFLGTLSRDHRLSFEGFGWDGEQVHLLTRDFRPRQNDAAHLIVRPRDGQIVGHRSIPSDTASRAGRAVSTGGFVAGLSKNGSAFSYSLRRGTVARHEQGPGAGVPGGLELIEAHGPWVHLRWRASQRGVTHKTWVLRPGEPGYSLRRIEPGHIVGDTLYETDSKAGTVTAVDLPTQKAVTARLPAGTGQVRRIIAARAVDGALWVLSEQVGPGNERRVRVDAFDRGTGRHRRAQLLRGPLPDGVEAAWGRSALLLADASGLHAFVPAPPGAPSEPAPHVVHPVESPIRVDGALDDWRGADTLPLRGGAALDGRLLLAHDATHLYLAASYRDATSVPRVGRDAGDRLEVGLTTNLGSFHWAVGRGSRGRLVWDALDPDTLPEGLEGAVRYDPGSDQIVYELAVPRASLFNAADPRWRHAQLGVTVWDDRPGGSGPVRALTLGGPRRAAREAVFFATLARRQEAAAAVLLRELPDLPASAELLEWGLEGRQASTEALVARCWEIVERHPHSMAAECLLRRIDAALRKQPGADPAADILARAAKAGVPEPVRRRYELYANAYLSQWVHVAEGKRPRSIVVMLNGGTGSDEWGYRGHWGGPARGWAVPPTAMGPIEAVPQGAWHELRVPLRAIQMHDKPVHGISLLQQGGGLIVWDRSAIVAGGREIVFIDDAARGPTHDTWRWNDAPVHSGARAHSHLPPTEASGVVAHALTELDEPVIVHLEPPLDRPYLSQWVHLSGAPTETLIVSLHDGARWAFRGVWGKRLPTARYLGPLPKAGAWHELRLPLAWTPFLTRPIDGIAFEHRGGTVMWDRTALAVGGTTHVVIDDQLPETRRPPRAWRSWLQGHQGDTRPVAGRIGLGAWLDGRTGCVRAEHAPELDPLEFTLEAWIRAEQLPPSGTKRWILSKNQHAATDGFMALLICGDKVVGDLNIGGGLDNRFEAWSPPGVLKAGQWHHLAATFDGKMLKTWCDGAQVAATAVNRPRKPGTGALYIGRWASWSRYFAGIVDEARVYRRALSADELRARHARPEALAPDAAAAVVRHWSFDADAIPADPAAEWQWVEKPVHSGRLAHTQPAARGFAGHAVLGLAEPLTQHLPYGRARATAVLKANIPRLGRAEAGWSFCRALLDLHAPGQRIGLCEWFLDAVPRHPRQADALGALLEAHRRAGTGDPAAAVEATIEARELPPRALYDYRRRYLLTPRACVRNWQVLGPFRSWGHRPFGPELPPDGGPVRLDRAYPGIEGDIRWAPHESPTDHVDFDRIFTPNEDAVAYAACWVHSDRRRPALVAVGSDDDCMVWVNRRLVVRGDNRTYAQPGEFLAAVELKAGPNEVLVRVSEISAEWRFFFELLDPLARGPLPGVRVSTTPPPK